MKLRMNNTKEPIKGSKIEGKQSNNEKKETSVDVEVIPDVSTLSIDSKAIFNMENMDKTENICREFVICTEEDETRNTILVADDVNNQQKTPKVWVQYNQTLDGKAIRSPGKQIEIQRRPSHGDRYHQYQGTGYTQEQDPWNPGRYEYNPLDYNPHSRNGFLMLVFTILLVMLALTFLFNLFVLFSPDVSDFYLSYRKPLLLLSACVMLVVSCVPMCCLQCLRTLPWNIIFLLIAVLVMSNVCAVFTVMLRTELIMIALLATSVTVAVCVLLALTKFDFTSWYLYAVVIMTVLIVLSLAVSLASLLFGFYFKPLSLAILFIATLVQIILLVMELQMVIGGKTIEIQEDDYVLAAYLLYTSIVNLFLQMLMLVANFDSN